MNETMESRLTRLCQDADIYKVDILTNCKTEDGMIYTLREHEFDKSECPEVMEYPEWVCSVSTHELLHIMGILEEGKGFYASVIENVAVRKDKIVRVWIEIGDAYCNGPIKES